MNPLRLDPYRNNRARKGIVLPLFGVLLVLMIPIVGLAIDASVLYVLKARLSSASDAAAIAAARSLNIGLTISEQEVAARARALAFFNANFPPGSWATNNQTVTVTVAESSYRTRSVTVNAYFDAPQYFMRYLGFNSTRVRGEGKASRRDVNLMLILDRSGSMADTATNGKPCTTMKGSATTFVNMFAEGRDRLGLIVYSSGWYLAFDPSMTFKTGAGSIPDKLTQVTCAGGTSTGMALSEAYLKIQTINEPGVLNMIVLFTDGYPNGVAANYPIRDQSDTRNGYNGGYYKFVSDPTLPAGFYIKDTSTAYCTSTGSSCTNMEPSPCQDMEGDVYDRNTGDTRRRYNAPNWNPSWTPNNPANPRLIKGVITPAGSTTWGLLLPYTNLNDNGLARVAVANAPGCAFAANTPTNPINPNTSNLTSHFRDFAYIPSTDSYNNSTSGYKTVPTYTSGPYAGQKRIDTNDALKYAGMNVSDNAAATIRNDNTLKPVIYTIGLGSNGGVDHDFLRRLSNDPTSPIFDNTKAAGVYAYAATTTDLNQAFVKIASEILRIAQ
jgi:Flp pilus assembly protein TadG